MTVYNSNTSLTGIANPGRGFEHGFARQEPVIPGRLENLYLYFGGIHDPYCVRAIAEVLPDLAHEAQDSFNLITSGVWRAVAAAISTSSPSSSSTSL